MKLTLRYIASSVDKPERTLSRWRDDQPKLFEAVRQFAERKKALESTIPLDVARCSGRNTLEIDGEWCPHRNNCKRYMAFVEWDRAAGLPDYKGVPVMMAVRDCDVMIPVEEIKDGPIARP